MFFEENIAFDNFKISISQQETLMALKNTKRSRKIMKKRELPFPSLKLQISSSCLEETISSSTRIFSGVISGGKRGVVFISVKNDRRQSRGGLGERETPLSSRRDTSSGLLPISSLEDTRGRTAGRRWSCIPGGRWQRRGGGGDGGRPRVRAQCLWFHNFRAAERAPSDESAPARAEEGFNADEREGGRGVEE